MRRLAPRLAAALLLLPAADARAQGGVLGRVRRGAQEALAGGAAERRGPFPAGFADPEFALTGDRIAAVLRASDRAAAAGRANRALLERDAAARRPRARNLDAEQAFAACMVRVGSAVSQLRLGEGGAEADPKRARLSALRQRQRTIEQEAQAKGEAAAPAELAALEAAAYATIDTMARVLGTPCPPVPASFARAQDDDGEGDAPAAGGGTPAGWVDEHALFLRGAGLTDRQWGVMRDKLVAYFAATRRGVELAGFSPEEVRALQASAAELARRRAALVGSDAD